MLLGMIARVMEPEIKFDNTLVLVEKKDRQILHPPWPGRREDFSGSSFSFSYQEAYEAVRGKWLIEISDLSAAR